MSRLNLVRLSLLLVLILLWGQTDLVAQCPMCKMSAESNMRDGGTAGNGLNAGILYMLATPYLLVGTLAYLWWRNKKRITGDTEAS
jgi:hypothetical protein